MPAVTWSRFTFTCQSCLNRCLATEEAIEAARVNFDVAPDVPDSEVVSLLEFCSGCAELEEIEIQSAPLGALGAPTVVAVS